MKTFPLPGKPGKIVCVGRNYAAHAAELGNEVPEFPLLFLKPSSALLYDGGILVRPEFSSEMHHEVELVILIGRTLKNVSEAEASDAIKAYAIGLDMTLRDVQDRLKKKGHPWTVSKCFDGSAVISNFISNTEQPLTYEEIISLKVNGIVRQQAPLSLMLFSPAQLIAYISSVMTLEEGDLLFTGTPAGVGSVEPGDVIEAGLNDLLSLRIQVK